MSTFVSTIRPVPGIAGPFYVVSEQDGSVIKVTTAVPSLVAALNQARDDQSAAFQAIAGEALIDVVLKTRATP